MVTTAVQQSQATRQTSTPSRQSKPKGIAIQAKLTIGQPNDKYEQEADRIADQVMQMPDRTAVQRKCTDCEKEAMVQQKPLAASITPRIQRQAAEGREEDAIQTKPIQTKSLVSENPTPGTSLESRLNSSKSGGSPLPDTTRSFMENRIGADFSNVKVHTDSNAVQMSQELGAQAFTHGNHIYFNSGKYSPESTSGKHLLAHEMVHTLHQGLGIQRKKVGIAGEGRKLNSPNYKGNKTLREVLNGRKVLKFGSKGTAVRAIQSTLLNMNYPQIKKDTRGVFGKNTKSVIEGLQLSWQATIDGIVGIQTIQLLDMKDFLKTKGNQKAPYKGTDNSYSDCNSKDVVEMVGSHLNAARHWLSDVILKISAVRSGNASRNVERIVFKSLKDNFNISNKDVINMAVIASNLSKLLSNLNKNVPIECESECHLQDLTKWRRDSVSGYVYHLLGSKIHLCPIWFQKLDYFDRVRVILHESVHFYLNARGDTYEWMSSYKNLDTLSALKNADSYAVAVRQVFFHGAKGPRILYGT